VTNPVVIIGGGLAGLTCAKQLHTAGVEFMLLEASDGVGGRVRTDKVDGFLLDRGFQVLLRTYKIPYALPNQTSPAFDPPVQPLQVRDNIFVCGDHRTNGSINGAMQSGRLVAEEILRR
jgi:predicted NAD/FAD-dependent oxidoreductase